MSTAGIERIFNESKKILLFDDLETAKRYAYHLINYGKGRVPIVELYRIDEHSWVSTQQQVHYDLVGTVPHIRGSSIIPCRTIETAAFNLKNADIANVIFQSRKGEENIQWEKYYLRKLSFLSALNPLSRYTGSPYTPDAEMLDHTISESMITAWQKNHSLIWWIADTFDIILGNHISGNYYSKGVLDLLIFPLIARQCLYYAHYNSNLLAGAIWIPLEMARWALGMSLMLALIPIVALAKLISIYGDTAHTVNYPNQLGDPQRTLACQ